MTDAPAPTAIPDFLQRWAASGAAERANYQLFLSELCDLIGVPRPEPTRPDDAENAYVFERAVTFHNSDGSTSPGRIDLYKRGCFLLEAKQGSDRAGPSDPSSAPKRSRRGTAIRGTAGWDDAMLAARGQAEGYVRALPASEPNPPFLLVVDVGHVVEVYSDFSRQGRTYTPFPDATSHRIRLADLERPEVRERLRGIWTDPLALDPSRHAARVTKDVADRLARLAKSLEASGHAPDVAAQFLMRCLFTFFAEDVGLLKRDGFTDLLRDLRDRRAAHLFPGKVRSLWESMRTGTDFSPILEERVLRFNGGLFESAEALPLDDAQIALMVEAGERGWRDVEPAIFGTLLERALNPVERHKLGAHYTPRAYVERLVMPAVIDPLRDEWANVQAAAVTLANEGKLPEARDEVRGFLRKLCDTTVLDPACGTGNFLYVTLEHMKRLEGEVLDSLRGFGESQEAFEGFGLTVDPHQLRGIEINPRAAAIADLVLWIGYLQWHFRTQGQRLPAEPIIHAYHNIECRDAVLAHDGAEVLRDERGNPVTRWDGRTTKPHPVTGEEVPDETARVFVMKYTNPRKAEWPDADYIVGNPPFIGNKRMRTTLGDGYVDALRSTWRELPETLDFVMYWWSAAADRVASGQAARFGFITTNSITQTFNRKVTSGAIAKGLRLVFAIPDHPWVDAEDGAAVRVAMTVGSRHGQAARLLKVTDEQSVNSEFSEVSFSAASGEIGPDLSVGAAVSATKVLRSNQGLSFMGVTPVGEGFLVTPEVAGTLAMSANADRHLRPFVNGKDLMDRPRGVIALDFFGLDSEEVRSSFPAAYQWLLDRVKPERDHNARETYRKRWWIFAEPRQKLREALKGLDRYIATCRTAKHRVFTYLGSECIPDSKVVAITHDGASVLGVLSSRIHTVWALRAGAFLGVGNDSNYNNSECFDKFPFPPLTTESIRQVGNLAEQLDAHRKARQAEHPTLTLTGMYNVLARLRAGEPLTDKERILHEQGLVSVLKQIHDDLDAAVFDAYGWPRDLSDEEILARLVALNRERAEEESRGLVRWLRPEYQDPRGQGAAPTARQSALPIAEPEPEPSPATSKPGKRPAWPKALPDQAQAVRAALAAAPGGLTPEGLAKGFLRGSKDRAAELLETLASLGQARALDDGRYVRA